MTLLLEPVDRPTTKTRLANYDDRRGVTLLVAFLFALALHAIVLVAVMFHYRAPPAPPGEQLVTIDLPPVMADAPMQAPVEQETSQSAPKAGPVEEPTGEASKPPPAGMSEVKPDEEQPMRPPPASIEPLPDARPIETQDQVITSITEQPEPLAPPPPATVKAAEPRPVNPKPDPAKLKAEREARLRKRREEKRRQEEREERLEAIREAKTRTRENAAREAKAQGAQARRTTDARDSASASRQSAPGRAAAGNDPSALRQWTGAISAAIHGRMNPGVAVGTGGGTALVHFIVTRSGAVTGSGLARSSGNGQIDSAALSAVRGTLPAAPPGVALSSLSVTIPLNYRLR